MTLSMLRCEMPLEQKGNYVGVRCALPIEQP